jgi:hypothetical protein
MLLYAFQSQNIYFKKNTKEMRVQLLIHVFQDLEVPWVLKWVKTGGCGVGTGQEGRKTLETRVHVSWGR